MTSHISLEAGFEAELARDLALRRGFRFGSWIVSLSTITTLLILIMPLQRTSPWLLALSLYAISTRLSSMVSWKAFLFPRFLLHLDDNDAATVEAARSVFERNRTLILEPILTDLMKPSAPKDIAALDHETLARLAHDYDIEWYRRLGRRWLLAWCIVSAVIWTIVVATGGGPVT